MATKTVTQSTSKSLSTGGCACGHIRYALEANPLIIHCCHCYVCQRETGSAFAINILIESGKVSLDKSSGKTIAISTPSESGAGQLIVRCPKCYVALWSNYAGAGPHINFVRGGTLDPEFKQSHVPDVHIFTESKLDWVTLPEGALAKEEFYNKQEVWPKESIERFNAIQDDVGKWRKDTSVFWKGQVEFLEGDELEGCLGRLKI